MVALERGATTPSFVPDFVATSLSEVDFEALKKSGIRFIAFDADSTLVPFRGRDLSYVNRELLKKKRHLFKTWCIASNRLSNDLQPLAESIDATVVRATIFTRKPSRRYFKKVLKQLGGKPEETAMIGDKLLADMWGAKRAGLTTVWLEKIGKDNPLDNIFRVRHIEKRLMKAYWSSGS